jgi:hypothetical protein
VPFVPLTPEEQERYKPPCRSPDHLPPSHMVFSMPGRWVCPACGQSTLILGGWMRCNPYTTLATVRLGNPRRCAIGGTVDVQ